MLKRFTWSIWHEDGGYQSRMDDLMVVSSPNMGNFPWWGFICWSCGSTSHDRHVCSIVRFSRFGFWWREMMCVASSRNYCWKKTKEQLGISPKMVGFLRKHGSLQRRRWVYVMLFFIMFVTFTLMKGQNPKQLQILVLYLASTSSVGFSSSGVQTIGGWSRCAFWACKGWPGVNLRPHQAVQWFQGQAASLRSIHRIRVDCANCFVRSMSNMTRPRPNWSSLPASLVGCLPLAAKSNGQTCVFKSLHENC